MADDTTPAPAPAPLAPIEAAPAPAEAPAATPPVVTSTGGLSDADAFAASADPSLPAPPVPEVIEAAPGEITPAGKKAKFPFYKDLATGEVYPALRSPAGYEDYYPNQYEGVSELPKPATSE